MHSIDVIDSIEILTPPAVVFNTVLDYPSIQHWFPQYSCELLNGDTVQEGSQIQHRLAILHIIQLSKFIRRIDRISTNAQIEESYITGDLFGTGVWQFIKSPQGTTYASYHCKVTANTVLVNLGIKFMGAQSHSLVFQYLLKRLKYHCESLVTSDPQMAV